MLFKTLLPKCCIRRLDSSDQETLFPSYCSVLVSPCELGPQFLSLSWQEFHLVWSSAAVVCLLLNACCVFRDAILHILVVTREFSVNSECANCLQEWESLSFVFCFVFKVQHLLEMNTYLLAALSLILALFLSAEFTVKSVLPAISPLRGCLEEEGPSTSAHPPSRGSSSFWPLIIRPYRWEAQTLWESSPAEWEQNCWRIFVAWIQNVFIFWGLQREAKQELFREAVDAYSALTEAVSVK